MLGIGKLGRTPIFGHLLQKKSRGEIRHMGHGVERLSVRLFGRSRLNRLTLSICCRGWPPPPPGAELILDIIHWIRRNEISFRILS